MHAVTPRAAGHATGSVTYRCIQVPRSGIARQKSRHDVLACSSEIHFSIVADACRRMYVSLDWTASRAVRPDFLHALHIIELLPFVSLMSSVFSLS